MGNNTNTGKKQYKTFDQIKLPPNIKPRRYWVEQQNRREQRMVEYAERIRGLEKGDVGKIEPEPGERISAVKTRLHFASRRVGISLKVWDVDGVVYFAKTPDVRLIPAED